MRQSLKASRADDGRFSLVMPFEDISHGHMRTIYLQRPHPEKLELSWEGDSVGFNGRTWLNDQGAQQGESLHLVERIRPIVEAIRALPNGLASKRRAGPTFIKLEKESRHV